MIIVTILAAGIGKRMNSTTPKVLHIINEKPMLLHIIEKALSLKPSKIIIVVNPATHSIIKETIQKYISFDNLIFAVQSEPLGTANAVLSTLKHLDDNTHNIILNGDTPLLTTKTLQTIYSSFISNKKNLQITAIELENPTNNGRIILTKGTFEKIVEEKDCSDEEKKIKLINCGIYIATSETIKKYIPQISNNNKQKEFYLTDIVELVKNKESEVGLYTLPSDNYLEIINVNTPEDLKFASKNI